MTPALRWILILWAVLAVAACHRKSLSLGETRDSPSAHRVLESPALNREETSPLPEATAPARLSQPTPENAPSQVGNPPHLPHGSPLLPEEAHRLLTGTVIFNPRAIPSSNVAIGPETPLRVGDDLQLKWGNEWWAGTVLGFEPDGRVRIHYFGWAASWDEPKPRAELQLDPAARVRALDSTYVRKNW